MRAVISPSVLLGSVAAPPSKSYAHRLLIGAFLSGEGSTVHGIQESEDLLATLDCLRTLGGKAELTDGTVRILSGLTAGGAFPLLPCRESGSTMRFLIPLALALRGGAEVRGSARLMERGIGVYETIFAKKGITFSQNDAGISLRGTLCPGEYSLRGDVSSQFFTGLLFALPLLEGDSTLHILPPVESRSYLSITLEVLNRYGIRIEKTDENSFFIPGNQQFSRREDTVEGDWSNAAFLLAMNLLGAQITVTDLNPHSLQGDRVFPALAETLISGAPINLSDCPDLGPVLFGVAAAKGGGELTGIRRLRLKESDRAAAMAEELQKFGIRTVLEENRAILYPGTLQKPDQILNAHNDHRIAMALTVLCSLTGGVIEGAECVKKSYPDFFRDLQSVGLTVTV